ncbi:Hint domain-containing protein [Ascidiaceihabitans sp.]|nr:Hint domain-containing protein [Ascidiaceihabitans sp.]
MKRMLHEVRGTAETTKLRNIVIVSVFEMKTSNECSSNVLVLKPILTNKETRPQNTVVQQGLTGFATGTCLATTRGEVPVEDLRAGDKVFTRDNGMKRLAWVGKSIASHPDLIENSTHNPIHISKGALGDNMPTRDMVVSPNQRFLITSTLTNVLVGESEVLVAAKFLTNLAGVRRVVSSQVDYILVMFDHHEIVLANSAWAESFQPDELSLHQIGDVQRTEILMQFPDLYTAQGQRGFRSARRSLKQGEASTLDRRKSL